SDAQPMITRPSASVAASLLMEVGPVTDRLHPLARDLFRVMPGGRIPERVEIRRCFTGVDNESPTISIRVLSLDPRQVVVCWVRAHARAGYGRNVPGHELVQMKGRASMVGFEALDRTGQGPAPLCERKEGVTPNRPRETEDRSLHQGERQGHRK